MYSYARKHLYNNLSNIPTKDLESYVMCKFHMNHTEARSVINEVRMLIEQSKTNKAKTSTRIVEVQKLIDELKLSTKKSKKDQYELHKLYEKLARLKRSFNQENTFGGKEELRKISYLSNTLYKSIKESEDDFDFETYRELNQRKTEFKQARINYIFLMGEANQKGNRFFDFDLTNNTIYYKPFSGMKIKIVFKDKRKAILKELQTLIDKKEIAISVRMSNNTISLSYDESIVSGYKIDEKKRKYDVKEIKELKLDKETESKLIVECYKKHHKELENLKMQNKKSNRYLAFDSNPNFIGCCILDKISDKNFNIVKTFYYDLTKANEDKTNTTHLSNVRKHGIIHIWDDIFKTMNYYKCAHIVKEKLVFTPEEIKLNKNFNHQTKNVWYRTLSNQIINKKCNENGIIEIEINAIYSSTIGNLIYNYVDCINASIEIGRRGIFGFTKDAFFPNVLQTDLHAMSRINKNSRDVVKIKECKNWKKIHAILKSTRLRYRKSLRDLPLIGCPKKYTKSSKLSHSKIMKVVFV